MSKIISNSLEQASGALATLLAAGMVFLLGAFFLIFFAVVGLVLLAPWLPLFLGMYFTIVGEYDWAVFALFCQIFILALR